MSYFPVIRAGQRAFRKQIKQQVLTELIATGRKMISGNLKAISVNGGCAVVPTEHPAGTVATVRLHSRVGRINAIAEMLKAQKSAGGITQQAFRFLALEDDDYQRLQELLHQF